MPLAPIPGSQCENVSHAPGPHPWLPSAWIPCAPMPPCWDSQARAKTSPSHAECLRVLRSPMGIVRAYKALTLTLT